MTLSKLERYSLSNQLRILEALYPSESEEIAVQREAIESGYEMIYDIGMDHILVGNDMMTMEESQEVWDVMDMFLSIDVSTKNQDSAELKKEKQMRFRGYDGNNEGKFMGFAQYTVERLKRFTHLPLKEENYFNSHMPMREIYRRMLEVWKEISYEDRFPMKSGDLNKVLKAATHPDQR